jgi:hypothetical protein
MATKKCVNGHLYDPAIYGDKCPFCPSAGNATKVNDGFNDGAGTKVLGGDEPLPTAPLGDISADAAGGHTVIRHVGGNATGETGVSANKRLVGLLVSYSAVATGEVYKIYEGVTTIGRDRTCSLPFPNDQHMSSKHLLIQYVEAKGAFKAKDMGSSNGSNVNGNIYVMDETIDLKTNDKILLGSTLFVFMAIPQ